jgi:hypothetical protein
MTPPSSGSKNKPETNVKQVVRRTGSAYDLLHAGFWLGSFFDPEVGGDLFLRNVGCLSTDYTTL